jgi:N-acetylglucosamine-6-sulfatase
MDKRWMYEESMRMPLIVRYPKLIKAGSTCSKLVNNTDFAPTLLDLAGVETPKYMHGRSALPLLKGEIPADWRTGTYYRYWMHMVHHWNPAHFGIRTEKYKLMFYYGCDKEGKNQTPPGWELYDMVADPHEMNNLYKKPEMAETIKQLKTELLALRKEFNETDEKYPAIQKIINAHWND